MERLETRRGFVAFLDILGYANILENNSPEYIANEVFKILADARQFTQEYLPRITDFPAVKKFDYNLINFISFSDSILVSVDMRNIPEKDMVNCIFVYLLYCSFISRMMHENGLPVRGGIDFGEYIMVNNFIAGLPIIEGYKLGCKVELEGIVFTERASAKLVEICKDCEYGLQHIVVPYLVQMKNDTEQKVLILSPSPCTTPIYGDLREYVLRSFWKHHKDISKSVRAKIDNTEQYLRYLKTFHDHLFMEKPPDLALEKKSRRRKNSKNLTSG